MSCIGSALCYWKINQYAVFELQHAGRPAARDEFVRSAWNVTKHITHPATRLSKNIRKVWCVHVFLKVTCSRQSSGRCMSKRLERVNLFLRLSAKVPLPNLHWRRDSVWHAGTIANHLCVVVLKGLR